MRSELLRKHVEGMDESTRILLEAVEFYAGLHNYDPEGRVMMLPHVPRYMLQPIDRGAVARAALEAIEDSLKESGAK